MKSLLPSFAFNAVLLALLLGCAGRSSYWPAWVYVGSSVAMSVLMRLVLRSEPELLEERRKPGPNAKAWDKKLLGLAFLVTIAMLVVAGLDAGRFHFEPVLTWPFFVVGLALNITGLIVFLAALRENRFFSSVVRIQSERGHTVCSTGPYRLVRHPGYAGMIIGTLGAPLLLMSAWCAPLALLSVAVTIVRTYREDRTLQEELPGYRDYCRATPYLLIPRVW